MGFRPFTRPGVCPLHQLERVESSPCHRISSPSRGQPTIIFYAVGVTRTWSEDVLLVTRRALVPESNGDEARAMAAYMKHVAPFLGVRSMPRRLALRGAWRELDTPTSNELGDACVLLMNRREREYHYAAYDLIETYVAAADETFLVEYVEDLLTTKPWWDTVDGLGSTAVSPLCWRYDASELVQRWSRSPNMWLNRAAIQHQRGWKGDTDVKYVLSICDAHSSSREFFVAKAIGWALRDLARLDAPAVRAFLHEHPALSPVAVREARRGLGEILRRPKTV
jgi:3-methyladenine DNA glycosylase AlkD